MIAYGTPADIKSLMDAYGASHGAAAYGDVRAALVTQGYVYVTMGNGRIWRLSADAHQDVRIDLITTVHLGGR